jgi:hypothetical protein
MNLHEIGDSHYSPQSYSVTETNVNPVSSNWKALFKIDDVVYFCLIETGLQVRLGDNGTYGVEIHFGVENAKEVGVADGLTGDSNKFHQYKIMPTLVQILKDYLQKYPKVKMFRFSSSSDVWKNVERFNDWDSPPNNTRFKMYLQYAMKGLPPEWELHKIVKPDSNRPYAYFKKVKVDNKLQENIHRIKEVMGLISELNIKRKGSDSGSYKNVYFSENNPDIVYKVSDLNGLRYEQAIFGKYPDLFCNPIGEPKKMSETISRTKGNGEEYEDDVYYLAYEKLDTEKYMGFYRNMEDTFENNVSDEIKKEAEEKGWTKKIPNGWGTNDYFEFCIYNICTDPYKRDAVKLFNTMTPIVKQENSNYYNDYLQFIDLLYKITSLEEYDSDLYWDFNNGNFGYDKTGKIKCLDI